MSLSPTNIAPFKAMSTRDSNSKYSDWIFRRHGDECVTIVEVSTWSVADWNASLHHGICVTGDWTWKPLNQFLRQVDIVTPLSSHNTRSSHTGRIKNYFIRQGGSDRVCQVVCTPPSLLYCPLYLIMVSVYILGLYYVGIHQMSNKKEVLSLDSEKWILIRIPNYQKTHAQGRPVNCGKKTRNSLLFSIYLDVTDHNETP